MKYEIKFTIDIPTSEIADINEPHLHRFINSYIYGIDNSMSNQFYHYEISDFNPDNITIKRI